MKKIVISLVMALAAVAAFAASRAVQARVDEVRKAYENRLNKMQNRPYEDILTGAFVVDDHKMLPGTGLADYHTVYYYDDDQKTEDDMITPVPQLYFVESRVTLCHGNYVYYYELLFDQDTEKPMFVYATARFAGIDNSLVEWRFYFDKRGNIIQQVPATIKTDSEDSLYPFYNNYKQEIGDLVKSHLNIFHALKGLKTP